MNANTRQRILEAAAKLGYVQNQLAIATRTGQVNTIAVILNFNDMQNPAMNQILSGIMMETAERKYSVKVFSDSDLAGAFQTIAENRIGKVISMSIDALPREKTADLAEKYALDLVYAYERGHRNFPAVNVDNTEMTSRAVHYLAERGHSRIGLLCGPHTHYYKSERHDGYLRGMAECGLKADPRWVVCSEDTDEAIDSILGLPDGQRPTACVSATDSDAVCAQHRAWKRGLRIPEEFSVIGIGDMESSRLAMLPITTFRESLQNTGKLLVRLVLGEKPDFPPDEFNVYRTHAEMIERKSVFNRNNLKIKTKGSK
jgi:LacI family transcriptional regulator